MSLLNPYPDASIGKAWEAAQGDPNEDRIAEALTEYDDEVNAFIAFCIMEDKDAADEAYIRANELASYLLALNCDSREFRSLDDIALELEQNANRPIPEVIS